MLSGDFGRSCFAAATCTILFAIVVPCFSSFLTNELPFPEGFNYLLGFFSTCFLGVFLQSIVPRLKLDPRDKSVLITGCDTGFGLLLAKQLHTKGMQVFAGCLLRNKGGEGAKELARIGSDRLHVLQLDVTSEEQVQAAVLYVQKHLPKNQKGLWGIVNNAGASAFGDVEWSSIELYKKVSEVNLWGLIRCTKAFLPSIRRANGRVVNMASGLGRMMAPSRSVYGLSKWAVEGFSDCLRYEMRDWGVKVSIIEPGNYIAGTNIFTKSSVQALSKSLWSEMSEEVRQDYGEAQFKEKVNTMKNYVNAGISDLSPVLNSYEDALLSRFPFTRYQPMESYWTIRSFIFTHFPSHIADRIYIYRKL